MELKPGDVVMLKSGGHPVTVAEVNDEAIVCLWMGGDGDLFRETLPLAVLEMAEAYESDDEDEDKAEDDDNEDDHEKSKVA